MVLFSGSSQMLTRRSLLIALANIPLLGRILPTTSTSSVKKVSEVVEKMYIGGPVFYLKSLPLPIVHSDFWFSARQFSKDMDGANRVLKDYKGQLDTNMSTEQQYDDNGLPIDD